MGGGGPDRMITVLVDPGTLVPGAEVALADSEVKHLRARRAGGDATVRLVDGAGTVGEGTVASDGRSARVQVSRVEQVPVPPALVLAVGAGDRDRFGWIMEKAAELGVTRVVPLETERSVNVASRLRPEQVERLEIRGREAIKQSGSAWAPTLESPVPLARFLGTPPAGVRWLADPEGAARRTLDDGAPVTILVGPEGGFTLEERAAIVDAGFLPVSLGPHVLRFETAAVAAAVAAWQARKESRG